MSFINQGSGNGNATSIQGIPVVPGPPANHDVIQYSSGTGQWEFSALGGGANATSIQGVPVNATPPAAGQVLGYNGSVWIPTTQASDSHNAFYLRGNLIDAALTPTTTAILQWDGSKYINSGAITLSSSLTSPIVVTNNTHIISSGFLDWSSGTVDIRKINDAADIAMGHFLTRSVTNTLGHILIGSSLSTTATVTPSILIGANITCTANGAIGINTNGACTIQGDNSINISAGVCYDSSINIGEGGTSLQHSVNIGIGADTGEFSVGVGGSTTAPDYSVVVGSSANCSNARSVAIGSTATAGGDYSIALGENSRTNGRYSMALGKGTVAGTVYTDDGALALGFTAVASATKGIAIGYQAIASGAYDIQFHDASVTPTKLKIGNVQIWDASAMTGHGSGFVSCDNSGNFAFAAIPAPGSWTSPFSNTSTTALVIDDGATTGLTVTDQQLIVGGGNATQAGVAQTVMLGFNNAFLAAGINDNILIGRSNQSQANSTIVIGYTAHAISTSARECVLIGDGAYAQDTDNICIGNGVYSLSTYNVALGNSAYADVDANYGVAIGYQAGNYSADYATSVGQFASVYQGVSGTSIGDSSYVYTADRGTAVGYTAFVSQGSHNSTALGQASYVYNNSQDSVALGSSCQVKNGSSGSIALGHGATVDNASRSICIGLNATTSASDIMQIHDPTVGAPSGSEVRFYKQRMISGSWYNDSVVGWANIDDLGNFNKTSREIATMVYNYPNVYTLAAVVGDTSIHEINNYSIDYNLYSVYLTSSITTGRFTTPGVAPYDFGYYELTFSCEMSLVYSIVVGADVSLTFSTLVNGSPQQSQAMVASTVSTGTQNGGAYTYTSFIRVASASTISVGFNITTPQLDVVNITIRNSSIKLCRIY